MYQMPTKIGNDGSMTITFTTPTMATAQLPGVALPRFNRMPGSGECAAVDRSHRSRVLRGRLVPSASVCFAGDRPSAMGR